MINKDKKILFLGAHMDDVEFGCGGLISSLIRSNFPQKNLFVQVLSKNLRDSEGKIVLQRDIEEQYKSFESLGLDKNSYEVNSVVDGQVFPEQRQKLLDFLYQIKNKFSPDIVFTNSRNDVHQDHRTLAETTLKAFNRRSIIYYQIYNSSHRDFSNFFFPIEIEDVQNKIKALNSFKSMLSSDTSLIDYFSDDVIKSKLVVDGLKSGNKYAECFEIERLIL